MTTNRTEWIGMLTAVCALLGALLAVTVKTQEKVRVGIPNVSNSVELSQEWEVMQRKIQQLQQALQDVHGRVDPATQTGQFAMLAGTLGVEGPGVVVTLKDNPEIAGQKNQAALSTVQVMGGIIHDTDVLRVDNELFAAGAEAVAVNGQRIGPRTAVRCVGPVVNINQVAVSAPFRIKAIGDGATLENALNLPGGVVQELRGVGCQVDIQQYSAIKIPPFDGAVIFRYAHQDRHNQEQQVASRE
ncbi:MAG: DUF881 domain-containing protein [Chloroflexi bacterium]|nr:DUF881 domain-containing protein [Chloroflexota bacterium]